MQRELDFRFFRSRLFSLVCGTSLRSRCSARGGLLSSGELRLVLVSDLGAFFLEAFDERVEVAVREDPEAFGVRQTERRDSRRADAEGDLSEDSGIVAHAAAGEDVLELLVGHFGCSTRFERESFLREAELLGKARESGEVKTTSRWDFQRTVQLPH